MTDAAPFVLPAPRFETRDAFVAAGLRERYRFADGSPADAVAAQWGRFAPRLGTIPGAVPGADYGFCFMGEDGFDYLCGVEIAAGADPEGLAVARVPALRYAVFPHDRHIAEFPLTIDAIFGEWLPASGHALAQSDGAPGIVERYGPGYDPAAGIGDIEIWIPLAASE